MIAVTHLKTSLALLGSFVLTSGGNDIALPRKAQALLAILTCRRDEPFSREVVADMLWTDRGEDQARQSLRQCLSTIRQRLGSDLVQAQREFLRIPPDRLLVDARAFEALATSYAREDLVRSADLYRGELLAGFPAVSSRFDEWLGVERGRLAALATTALRRLAEVHAAAGDFDAGIAAGRHLVALDDLNEDAQRLVIRLLARAGRRAEAPRQYESCAETLKRELRLAPEPQTVELMRSIRNGAESSSISAIAPGEDPPAPSVEGAIIDCPRAEMPAVSATEAGEVRRRRFTGARLAGAVVAVCVAAGMVDVMTIKPSAPSPPKIVVAPFKNSSTITAQDAPIAGIADLIAADLSERYSLRNAQYSTGELGTSALRERIKSDAAARYLVEGSVSFGTTLEVAVRISNRDAIELWSERYEVPRSQILNVVDDIGVHISRAVAQDAKSLRADPVPLPDPDQITRELLALADYLRLPHDATSIATSERIVKQAARRNPNNADALALCANAYLNDYFVDLTPGNLTTAGQDADRSLELDPTNVLALWDKCLLLRVEGHPVEALEVCRRGIDINPRHAGMLREIGHDLLLLDDPGGAIGWFKAAIAANPTQLYVGNAYAGIAAGQLALQHRDEALLALRESLANDYPGNPAGLMLAALLENDGRHDEAIATLAEFYQNHPEFPDSSHIPPHLISGFDQHLQSVIAGLRQLGVIQADAEVSPAQP
jgi:DNA-binding SARP family transcriptional activator/TolB-like protein/Tfp pilus assembly protein PilF